jgi:hypothetical protein
MLAALVPQFRTVGFVMVLSLGMAYYFRNGLRALVKPALVLVLLVLACLPVWLMLSRTDFYQRRIADPTNAYNRLATYRVALEITREGWPRGVGLGRYEERFQSKYAPKQRSTPIPTEELSRRPQSTPHNNLLSVVAELGAAGILFYVLANITILLMGLKQLKCEGRSRAAGAAIITLWTAYTLVGLTLTSGYYSDLNLTFFFLLGILINFTGTEN